MRRRPRPGHVQAEGVLDRAGDSVFSQTAKNRERGIVWDLVFDVGVT